MAGNPYVPDLSPLHQGLGSLAQYKQLALQEENQARLADAERQRLAYEGRRISREEADAYVMRGLHAAQEDHSRAVTAKTREDGHAKLLGEARQLLADGYGADTAQAHANTKAKLLGLDPIKISAAEDPLNPGQSFGYKVKQGDSELYYNPKEDQKVRSKAFTELMARLTGAPMHEGAPAAPPAAAMGPAADPRLVALMERGVAGERGSWQGMDAIARPFGPPVGDRPASMDTFGRTSSPEGMERRWDRRTTSPEPVLGPSDLPYMGEDRAPLISSDELRTAADLAKHVATDESEKITDPLMAAVYRAHRAGVLDEKQIATLVTSDARSDWQMQIALKNLALKGAKKGRGPGYLLKPTEALAHAGRASRLIGSIDAAALKAGGQVHDVEYDYQIPQKDQSGAVVKDKRTGHPVMMTVKGTRQVIQRPDGSVDEALARLQAERDEAVAQLDGALEMTDPRARKIWEAKGGGKLRTTVKIDGKKIVDVPVPAPTAGAAGASPAAAGTGGGGGTPAPVSAAPAKPQGVLDQEKKRGVTYEWNGSGWSPK